MEFLKQPKPMMMEGNLSVNFKKFKQNFELYLLATGCSEKSQKIQAAVLLHSVGEHVLEIIETLGLQEDERNNKDIILQKLEQYFVPKVNTSLVRQKFNRRVQGLNEDFDSFLKDLRIMANECEYGQLKESIIKDVIISGIRDKRTKNKLLTYEGNLTLDKTIQICKAAEEADRNIKALTQTEDRYINEVKGKGYKQMKSNAKYAEQQTKSKTAGQGQRSQQIRTYHQGWSNHHRAQQKTSNVCIRCGNLHSVNDFCPARGKFCNICKKPNHFAKMCKTKHFKPLHEIHYTLINDNSVLESNVINTQPSTSNHDFVLDSISNDTNGEWLIDLKILECDQTVKFKIDTGAAINAIPLHIFNNLKLQPKILKPCQYNVSNYTGTKIDVVGKCDLSILYNNDVYKIECVIVKTSESSVPVLGLSSIKNLNILMKVDIVNNKNDYKELTANYTDLFIGIGKIKDYVCDFKLKDDYEPVVASCRKIPFQLMDKLKSELEKMENDEIIKKVTEPTEFM